MRTLIAFAGLLLATTVSADSIDRILGTWQTTDGFVRQTFEREFDRHWVNTKMWFMTEEGWKLVSTGAMYRRPGDHIWRGVTRSSDMDGVQAFEYTLEMVAESEYALKITAWMDTGQHFGTEEEWFFDGEDAYRNVIYRLDSGEREQWMEGSWTRVEE